MFHCRSRNRSPRRSLPPSFPAGPMRILDFHSHPLRWGRRGGDSSAETDRGSSARMKSRGFNFFPRPRSCSISLSQRAILPHFTFCRPRWPPTQYARTTDRKIANASPFSVRPPPPPRAPPLPSPSIPLSLFLCGFFFVLRASLYLES